MFEAQAQLPTEREANFHLQNMLSQFLAEKHQSGEIITYAELSQVAGDSVQGGSKGAYHLNVARKRVKKEWGMVFETVNRIGLKPLAIDRIAPTAGAKATARIRSISTAFDQTLGVVDTSKLSQQGLKDYLKAQVHSGFIRQCYGDGVISLTEAAEEAAKAKVGTLDKETIRRSLIAANEFAFKNGLG